MNNSMKTILIIDDEPAFRQSLAFFLEDQEYITIQAENGRTGLRIFEEEQIDLVLVDLRMPEVDGLEVLSRISKESPDTPMIVVSGTGEISDAVEALHKGAWDYLLKPIKDYSLLIHAVTTTLEKAQLIQENHEYQQNLELMISKKTEKISKELKEKEVLLRELNHRVKNNLNVIISLLNLKADKVYSDNRASEAFRECGDLVYSMTMIHEELYQSKSLSEISIQEYIKKLAIKMIGIYKPFVEIEYRIKIADINIDISKAIPCGLILTELITNALKYAFKSMKGKGLLEIICSKLEAGRFSIIIKDNGSGLPDSIDIRNPGSTGLQLVGILVNQIGGQLSVKVEKGTEFTIIFPG